MIGEYNNLWLCGLNSEQRSRTCGYWYTVTTSRGTAHTAFRTKKALMSWIDAHNLTVDGDILDEGKWFSCRIIGKIIYKYHPAKDILKMKNKFYCLENGRYTIGAIDGEIEYRPNCNDCDFVTLNYFKTSAKIDDGRFLIKQFGPCSGKRQGPF